MKKEALREGIEELIREIEAIRANLRKVETSYISLDDARKRDYIVRTDYYGSVKDKNIKKDFIEDVQNTLGDDIKSLQNDILNYNFYRSEKPRSSEEKSCDSSHLFDLNILFTYHRKLKEYEFKQIVLDTYGEKK